MRRFHPILWSIPLAVALAGCGVVAGEGLFKPRSTAGATIAAAPLDTAVIQTQTLGPAPADRAPATGRIIGASAPPAAATPTPVPQPASPPIIAEIGPEIGAEIGAAAAAALQLSAAETSPAEISPAAAMPQSPEEAACLDEGGRWGKAGNTSAMACFRPSNDGNKACSKESDCTSQCLARSRSCAPFWPMFGCTEVIQNDGAVVRLCLE